jgi:hypothetical protein
MFFISRSRIRNAVSITSVSLLVAGGSLLSVSAANAINAQTYPGVTEGASSPNYTVTVDCTDPDFWGYGEGVTYEMAPGGTVTVTTTGCTGNDEVIAIDKRNSSGAEPGGVSIDGAAQTVPSTVAIPATFVIYPNTEVEFQYPRQGGSTDTFSILVNSTSDPISNPAGELGQTTEVLIPAANPLSTNFPSPLDPANPGNGCELSNDGAEHVYQTYEFDVSTSGNYTFRFVATNPLDGDTFWWGDDGFAMQDPFLAVYSSFDPSNPSLNVIGCNDDGGNTGITTTGYFLDSLYPQFSSTLPAGHYTLVLTTFGDSPLGSWNDGAQGGTFELWGPPGSFAPAEPELAVTGMSNEQTSSVITVGAIALLLGGLGLIIRKRLNKN